MKQFSFYSFISVGLTLGIGIKIGVGVAAPVLASGVVSVTEFFNTPEFLNVLLPAVSYGIFSHIFGLAPFTSTSVVKNNEPVGTSTGTDNVDNSINNDITDESVTGSELTIRPGSLGVNFLTRPTVRNPLSQQSLHQPVVPAVFPVHNR